MVAVIYRRFIGATDSLLSQILAVLVTGGGIGKLLVSRQFVAMVCFDLCIFAGSPFSCLAPLQSSIRSGQLNLLLTERLHVHAHNATPVVGVFLV